ncbi:MAG: glucosamine-6-phosphate deaminase [Thermoactinomyces sp.]
MKLIRVKDYDEMCQKAAELLIRTVKEKKAPKLGLATGATPQGIYQKLVTDHWKNGTSYRHVTTFNLDEYVGLGPSDRTSYHYYMHKNLFNHIDIPEQQTHIPNGLADNLEEECSRYERLIKESGGVDLQILGIGVNGHIGFNEPGTPFDTPTHVVRLTESTRKANQSFFSSPDEVPEYAITMGLSTIMKSKEIVLLISGKHKAPVLKKLLSGEVSTDLPASILYNHPNVTIIADEAACS